VHIDLLSTSLRLLSADGRAAAAETFSDPHDLQALHDGLRQASTGAGEFGVELYNSVGVALRNSLSHFYNPETREGLVFPPLGDDAQELNPNPEVLMRARWEFSMLQGPHPSAVGANTAASLRALHLRQAHVWSYCCHWAADVVEWEYAKAVAARRSGDKAASFTALGRALHLVQGLTVPHHSADLP
jgi:hypothetical protein